MSVHQQACQTAAGPSPLQVIAAAVAVHIQHFAAGVETGDQQALQSLGIELVAAQTAGGDLCLIEAAHALHKEMGCICFENEAMGIYFINDPDNSWLEVLPAGRG